MDSDGKVKIADFGQARTMWTLNGKDEDEAPLMSGNVTTLWFKAPEILLGDK
jgi:serine/threonine protein kinase